MTDRALTLAEEYALERAVVLADWYFNHFGCLWDSPDLLPVKHTPTRGEINRAFLELLEEVRKQEGTNCFASSGDLTVRYSHDEFSFAVEPTVALEETPNG